MKIQIVFLTMVLVFLISCGSGVNTTKTPKLCTSEVYKDAVIRWGGHNMKTNYLAGWQLNAEGQLFKFRKDGRDSDYIITEFSKIDKDKFCELLDSTQKYFLEIQALYAPGDSSHFVELINPKSDVNLRAAWNMRFKTLGSKEFRMLYDSLEAIADREYKIYLKRDENPGNSVK